MLSLTCHPDARTGAVRGIRADVGRTREGVLAAKYVLEGEIDSLCIPPLAAPRMGDRLWQHTCFEIFIARKGLSPYHELNFSPSGAWAAYAFERYRKGAPLADASLEPHVSVRRGAGQLELDALIRLDRLSPIHARAALTVALSAVIEDKEGVLSYWALAHAPGKPDFHHPLAFVMGLDEVRD